MKTEKTTDERLKRYALNQQPMDDLDRHLPPTKTSTFMLYLLLSPMLALGAWLVLIWACLNTDAN
jgi:hypothetical protein